MGAGPPSDCLVSRAGERALDAHDGGGGEEQLNGKLRLAQHSLSLSLAHSGCSGAAAGVRSLPHPLLYTLAQHLVKHSRREKRVRNVGRADGPAQVRYQLSDEIIAASSPSLHSLVETFISTRSLGLRAGAGGGGGDCD